MNAANHLPWRTEAYTPGGEHHLATETVYARDVNEARLEAYAVIKGRYQLRSRFAVGVKAIIPTGRLQDRLVHVGST